MIQISVSDFNLSHMLKAMPRLAARVRPLPSICLSPVQIPRHRALPVNILRGFSSSNACRIMQLAGFTREQLDVREAVAKICSKFPDEYWARHDESGVYPHELHAALAKDGWIGIAMPEELGGSGLGISEATMMLQTISQSGAGIAGAQSIHANVYATQPVAKFAKEEQRKKMLPRLISGEWKACFGVTEPRSGDK